MALTTGARLIVRALQLEGVDYVFGIAGDHILPVLDVMADSPIRWIGTRHEAAAVHMADQLARSRSGPAVAMYTTAGFLNALAGLGHALYSDAPVISISGCAPLAELGRGAMQEIDQVGAARPFTKGSWLVPDARRIPEYFARAIRTAMSGRRGPVHLTIPIDVQDAVIDEAEVVFTQRHSYLPNAGGAAAADVEQAIRLLQASERPFVIAQGPAAYGEDAGEALRRFVETTKVPLFTEDAVRGLLPDDHPQVLGYFERGLNHAARLLPEADLVLLLGRKQEYTISYLQPPAVAAGARIIQVAPEAAEVATNRAVDLGLVGHVPTVVGQLADAAAGYGWHAGEWLDRLQAARAAGDAEYAAQAAEARPLHALHVHSVLRELLRPDDVLVFDGGDFCDLGRAVYPARVPRGWWYISGVGLLGTALPCAMGARLANPGRRAIAFTGDGGIGFNALELETAVREGIPVVVIVGNDSTWGIDYHLQMGLYGRPMATELTPHLRYDQLAATLGAYGEHVESDADLRPALQRALAAADQGQPAVVDITIRRSMSPRAGVAIARTKARMGERP